MADGMRGAPGAVLRGAILFAGIVLVLGAILWILQRTPSDAAAVSASPVALLSGSRTEGFARVTGPEPVVFPAAAGPHPDYRTEWWYYTGNLDAPDGRRFGFQLTFFRTALAPEDAADRTSEWATRQVYLGHFAVTDVDGGTFHSAERLARGAVGLAGARAVPFRVWAEDWSAVGPADDPGAVRLSATDGPLALDLSLRPVKPVALHGRDGYSVKGPQVGNASMYYSFTRLEAEGLLRTAAGEFPVTGLAWMDHEWSTSALDAETQTGWDWFSLQLDDGRELMLFEIRETDGGVAPESSGSLVGADGDVRSLDRDAFFIEVLDTWRSPRTGAGYPAGWRLTVPEHGLDLVVTPLLADQELSTFIRYWEGAVEVAGTVDGRPTSGRGYVELTGYTESGLPGGP